MRRMSEKLVMDTEITKFFDRIGQKEFDTNFVSLDNFIHKIHELKKDFPALFKILEEKLEEGPKSEEINNFERAFLFKLERLLQGYLDFEQHTLSSSLDGCRNLIISGNYDIKEAKNKMANFLDLFLTQFFSLFELYIKNVLSLTKHDFGDHVSNLGSLLAFLEKTTDDNIKILFQQLIINKNLFLDLQTYRDYLMHHGNLMLEPCREPISKEYRLDVYWIYRINKVSRHKYEQDEGSSQRASYLLRVNLYQQLVVFQQTLTELRNHL